MSKFNLSEYWIICAEGALNAAGIGADPDQIETVAAWIKKGHSMHGKSTGYYLIPDPRDPEVKRLKNELKEEQEKMTCYVCNGSKFIVEEWGSFQSTSSCWKCRGTGKL